jgi:hypothetical protein
VRVRVRVRVSQMGMTAVSWNGSNKQRREDRPSIKLVKVDFKELELLLDRLLLLLHLGQGLVLVVDRLPVLAHDSCPRLLGKFVAFLARGRFRSLVSVCVWASMCACLCGFA